MIQINITGAEALKLTEAQITRLQELDKTFNPTPVYAPRQQGVRASGSNAGGSKSARIIAALQAAKAPMYVVDIAAASGLDGKAVANEAFLMKAAGTILWIDKGVYSMAEFQDNEVVPRGSVTSQTVEGVAGAQSFDIDPDLLMQEEE